MPGVVVCGTGFGTRVHVPALLAAGFDVLALVGTDLARTQRRAERIGVEHAFASLDDALALDGVDAVTIATPPDTHAELAQAVCAAGRHVLCEKPFALDAAQARAMRDAAREAGVVHLVGHEFRWAPDRAVVARAIHDGLIGDPGTFSVVQYVPLVADPAARVPQWWFDAERGGGWLGASGSHLVDHCRTWFGEFAHVSASLPRVSDRPAGAADDTFVVHARMANGAAGTLHQTAASWTTATVGATVIAGPKGTIEVTGAGVVLSDHEGRRVLDVPDDLVLPTPPPSSDPRQRFTHLELGPYSRLCAAFRDAIEERECRSPVPVPTFDDGVAAMDVLDAIRASANRGGALVPVNESG